jgi:hypothetical protein
MSTVERTLEVDLRRKREEEERARKRKSVGDSRREEKKERKRRKMAHTHTRQTSSRIDQRRCKERYTRTHFLCGRQTVYRAWWTQS